MIRYFLAGLEVEGFRGINNEGEPLDLKFKADSVNSVFAVNGTGKSSIFEALSYAIRGNIPKLKNLQAQEKPQTYINNFFHSQKTATIRLTFKPDDPSVEDVEITVVRDELGTRSVSAPGSVTDPEAFLQGLDREFSLVDYQTFAQFMADTPLDRGRSFSSLVGLAKYSNLRQVFQSVTDTRAFNADFDTKALATEIQNLEQTALREIAALAIPFESLTGHTPPASNDIEEIAKQAVEALLEIDIIRSHVTAKNIFEIDFQTIRDSLIQAEGGALREEMSGIDAWISKAEAIGPVDESIVDKELEELEGLVDERQHLATSTVGLLHRRLYQDAHELMESTEWDEDKLCPLCQSGLTFSLSLAVDHQLTLLRHVVAKEKQIQKFYEESHIAARLHVLDSLEGISGKPIHAEISSACQDNKVTTVTIGTLRKQCAEIEQELMRALESRKERLQQIETQLPPSLVELMAQADDARQVRKSLESVRSSRQKVISLRFRQKLISRWNSFINEVSDTVAAAENAMSVSTLEKVNTEHKRLFGEIMRAGNIVPGLALGTTKQDLHINLENFHGISGLSAPALLSESYSNALAISLFLAAAVQAAGPARFIVLDDVTSSFDSGHQWQLMEQIRSTLQYVASQNGIQFIILSHDGLLEKYFDTLGNDSNWHHQKLQGMPPMGAISPTSQNSDRLKTTILGFLNSGQVDVAAPLIRQHLEHRLVRLITKLRIPVPIDFAIKDHQKMVANAFDAIKTAVDLHSRAGDLILDSSQIDELEKRRIPAIIGNFTSHYATGITSSFTPNLLKGVIEDIDALDECFKFDQTRDGQIQRTWYKSLTKQ